jgi:cell wall-associated NlpC family hydrolase
MFSPGRNNALTINGTRWSRYCLTATGAVFASGMASAQAAQTHTVKTGDNLSTLARKYHVSIHDLVQANHLTHIDALKLGDQLIIPAAPKPVVAQSAMHQPATIFGNRVTLRIGPQVTARRIDMFDMGARVTVTASRNEWFQVTVADGRVGWIHRDYLKLAGAQDTHPSVARVEKKNHHTVAMIAKKSAVHHAVASVKKQHVTLAHVSHTSRSAVHAAQLKHTARSHFAAASHASNRTRPMVARASDETPSNDVVRTAIAYRGTPYHYGGTGRGGFDCSGFTSYIYRKSGVSLPHNAAAQYSQGSKVAKSELKPGDLVFFHCGRRGISHVGIFVGNGKFVHASSPHSGGVRVDSLEAGYYKSTFRGARRIKK